MYFNHNRIFFLFIQQNKLSKIFHFTFNQPKHNRHFNKQQFHSFRIQQQHFFLLRNFPHFRTNRLFQKLKHFKRAAQIRNKNQLKQIDSEKIAQKFYEFAVFWKMYLFDFCKEKNFGFATTFLSHKIFGALRFRAPHFGVAAWKASRNC